MDLPTKELLFSPLRLACLLGWFYLCLYVLQNYRSSPVVPKRYKEYTHIGMLVVGPLLMFVFLVVDVVRRSDDQRISLIQAIKTTFGKPVRGARRRSMLGVRGDSSLILIDASGNTPESEGRSQGNQDRQETLEIIRDVVGEAIRESASDILIGPRDSASYNIRFRVDGLLRTICEVDSEISLSIVSSIKAMSGMDIAEKRRPQDGAFTAVTTEGNVSFRVASAGVLNGEKLSLRLLNQISGPLAIEDIGVQHEEFDMVVNCVHRQSGMVLICGPTGSGKSTTLYAMLREINFDERNVITIEDPIEYVLPEASQIEINPKADITFASTLRSVLRQDPDVISVGEIRDHETAEIALQASQTGHLVLATLHSSSNMGTLVRLIDLGIKPLLIASGLDMVISQRLMRRLCEDCKRPEDLSKEQIHYFQKRHIDARLFMQAKGCKRCGMTGYRGRIGVFDVMKLDDEIKSQLLNEKLSLGDFKNHGDEQFRRTLQREGMKHAMAGITSLGEVKKLVKGMGAS